MKLVTPIFLFIVIFAPFSYADAIPTGPQLQRIAEQHTNKIDTTSLTKMLDSELDMLLIDIRTKDEIRNMGGAIKVPQNINIPRGWLEYRVQRAAINKDTPIVVYCGAGLRSPFAAETLQKMGYTNVHNYSEGFFGWKKAGLPVAQ